MKEWRIAKKNGTFVPAGWTDGEVSELTGLLKKYKGKITKDMVAEFRGTHTNYTDSAVRTKAKNIRKKLNKKNEEKSDANKKA